MANCLKRLFCPTLHYILFVGSFGRSFTLFRLYIVFLPRFFLLNYSVTWYPFFVTIKFPPFHVVCLQWNERLKRYKTEHSTSGPQTEDPLKTGIRQMLKFISLLLPLLDVRRVGQPGQNVVLFIFSFNLYVNYMCLHLCCTA